jgi:hypothetical protein
VPKKATTRSPSVAGEAEQYGFWRFDGSLPSNLTAARHSSLPVFASNASSARCFSFSTA